MQIKDLEDIVQERLVILKYNLIIKPNKIQSKLKNTSVRNLHK